MQDRVVVIAGATGGIGSALAHQLGAQRTKLVLAARSLPRLEALAASLPTETLTVPTDITQPAQVERLMDQTLERFGRLDVLVNAAGAGVMKPWQKLEPGDLQAMLEVNLQGSFYTCQAAARRMQEQRRGHLCNLVGILGKHTMPLAAAYCAAKFGVVGFSKCLAEEVRRYGIKLTLFYLGGVDTGFWDTVALKVDRTKMLTPAMAAQAIRFALEAEPQAIPLEVNIQPESHVFF